MTTGCQAEEKETEAECYQLLELLGQYKSGSGSEAGFHIRLKFPSRSANALKKVKKAKSQ